MHKFVEGALWKNSIVWMAQSCSISHAIRAVVVAQLVERSLPTPEVRGSIPIGDINIDQYSTNCYLEETKIKKKRPGMAHL